MGARSRNRLLREGARVAVGDIKAESLEPTLQDIAAAGSEGLPLTWDLADLSLIDGHVSSIERRFGPVDVLINNTGGPPPTPASGQAPELWSKHFQAMVLSVIALTDRVLPGCASANGGGSSPAPPRASSRRSPIWASRTRCGSRWSAGRRRWRARLGATAITANIVLPGRVATKRILFLDQAKAERENRPVEEVTAESTGSVPVGRYGDPEEYADVVTFLASERASYVTGSVIRVDGGLIASI